MNEATLKKNIAQNITECRKRLNLTQFELAEKLNYSDKSISKWERGEALPDVYVLKQIADLFETSIDGLTCDPTQKKKRLHTSIKKRILIPALSVFFTFFIATFVYCFLIMFCAPVSKPWLAFIFAMPISAIVLIVFSAIWSNKIMLSLSVSLLNWFLALLLFLTIPMNFVYLFFIIATSFQVLIILWHFLIKTKLKNK